MRVRIKKGLDLKVGTIPGAAITDTKSSSTSILLGRDYPGARLHVLADEGARVRAGDPVLCDRRRPDILFTSPVSGTVSAIHWGARRRLISLQITADGNRDGIKFDIPGTLDRNNIQRLMLASGLWATLRCRPFGHIPNPDQHPEALLITAIDTQPLAPDPEVIISRYFNQFSLGLKLLCDLVDSPVFLCKSAHHEFQHDNSVRASVVNFDGPHPAGLAGTHIHTLCPVGFNGNEIWHIGYQDVISLGHLITCGKPWYERVVSLAGPAVKNPRLITVPLGAGIADITAGELVDGPARIISGSVLCGHTAAGPEACLGQRHNQVTAIFEETPAQPVGWLSSLFGAGSGDGADPLIPTSDLDRVAPPGILAVPLLRALLVGDVERARDLGALELVEEDLALLTYTCPSRTDYGPLLRDMLDQMYKEGLSTRS